MSSARIRLASVVCAMALLICCAVRAADELKAIKLPAPQTEGGKPLMQALKARQSHRSFAPDKLADQQLSNLLWAACGVNRPDGRRTAPTAVNWQEVDVYVALESGLYRYNAKENQLDPMLGEDIRAEVGLQAYVKTAPVSLIYVADRAKMRRAKDEDKDFYAATDTGFISQNVYLYCASEGLATVVIGMINKPKLAERMALRPEQRIILAQPVGKPAQ